jgi:hypothetical protein
LCVRSDYLPGAKFDCVQAIESDADAHQSQQESLVGKILIIKTQREGNTVRSGGKTQHPGPGFEIENDAIRAGAQLERVRRIGANWVEVCGVNENAGGERSETKHQHVLIEHSQI